MKGWGMVDAWSVAIWVGGDCGSGKACRNVDDCGRVKCCGRVEGRGGGFSTTACTL